MHHNIAWAQSWYTSPRLLMLFVVVNLQWASLSKRVHWTISCQPCVYDWPIARSAIAHDRIMILKCKNMYRYMELSTLLCNVRVPALVAAHVSTLARDRWASSCGWPLVDNKTKNMLDRTNFRVWNLLKLEVAGWICLAGRHWFWFQGNQIGLIWQTVSVTSEAMVMGEEVRTPENCSVVTVLGAKTSLVHYF